MPRRSAASLTVVPTHINVRKIRLSPPYHLVGLERAVFLELVAANPSEHFKKSDGPILEEYCRQCVTAREAADQMRQGGTVVGGKISPWFAIQQKATRAMCVLSTRLKLNPQARLHNKSVARQVVPRHPPPWKQDEAGDA